jgi:hypothetical protein
MSWKAQQTRGIEQGPALARTAVETRPIRRSFSGASGGRSPAAGKKMQVLYIFFLTSSRVCYIALTLFN